jgi:hypothetical protein
MSLLINNDKTYIYISREYYKGKCLDENTIGVGKTNDPIRRLKEHNSASSKSTVEIKFEAIYIVENETVETQIHKTLENLGFQKIKNEVFSGTDNNKQLLSLQYVKNIIKRHSKQNELYFENDILITRYTDEIFPHILPSINYYIHKTVVDGTNPKIWTKNISRNPIYQYYRYLHTYNFHYSNLMSILKNDYNILIKALKQNHIKFEQIIKLPDIYDFTQKLNKTDAKLYLLDFCVKNNYLDKIPLCEFTKENKNYFKKKIIDNLYKQNQFQKEYLDFLFPNTDINKKEENKPTTKYIKTHFRGLYRVRQN